MKARSLFVAVAILLPGARLGADFSAEKLALVDRPFQASNVALSPDGHLLAYTRYDQGKLWLFIANLDTHTAKTFPLVAESKKGGPPPPLKYLRWATSDRLVMVNADAEILSVDRNGRNAVELWKKSRTGLIQDSNLAWEPYNIVAGVPRLHPPLEDDPGHILMESVATIGAESFSNPYRVDVRTGDAEVLNEKNYVNWQVALYGRGDMLMWPPWPVPATGGMIPKTLLEAADAAAIPRAMFGNPPIEVRTPYWERYLILGNTPPEEGGPVYWDSSSSGRMLYDRRGNPRILYTEPTSGDDRDFLYTEPGKNPFVPNLVPPTLDKILGQPKSKEFTLGAKNYFGERSYPLAFDFDPNVLYYASNVGRDTYGIYSLNLKTKERIEIAPDIKGVDLATGDPEETDGILVFDEHLKKLVGVRYTRLRPHTFWLDPEFRELQSKLDSLVPNYGAQIESWDDDRRRFLVRMSSESDPGGIFIYHRAEGDLEQIASSTPWLAGTALNPAAPFSFETPGGVQLSGYLTLPNTPKLNPPPLMIYLQASLWDRAEPGFNRETEMLADMGVVVMRLNYRGSPGFGRKHVTAIQGGIDSVPSEDLIAAIGWLKGRTKIDLTRVMVMGESLGGYLAERAIQLHPDIFRCAITINAPTNLAAWASWSPLKETRPMYRNGTAGEVVSTTDFLSLVRKTFVGQIKNSSAKPPGGVARPMLVIESSGSTDTTPLSSMLSSLGIGARGVEMEHLWIDGEFHSGTLETRTKVFQRIEGFLNSNLYDYGATIGEMKEIKDSVVPRK